MLENKSRFRKVVPNGGWGWMVVIGAGIANMLNQSLVSLFGLLFGDHLAALGQGTAGIALVMNTASMVANFSGLVTGPLLKRYPPKWITIVGVLCTTLGMMLTGYTTQLWQILLSYSFLTGLGLGLIQPATFMAIHAYFEAGRRGQALGLALAGTGIGQMLLPQLVRLLLDSYGFTGTTLLMSALSLHGIAGALLFRPVEWHMKTEPILVEDLNENTSLLICHSKTYQGSDVIVEKVAAESTEQEQHSKQLEFDKDSIDSGRSRSTCGSYLSLLGDPTHIHISVGLALVYTCGIAFSMLYPLFLQHGSAGLNRRDTALCMSVLSGADLVGRLTIPTLSQWTRTSYRDTFLVGAALIALARTLMVFQTDYLVLILVSALCGYIRSMSVFSQNLVISENVTQADKLPLALGLNMVLKGFLVLTVGQLLGWFRDYTDSFIMCVLAQTAVMFIVVLSWSLEMLLKLCCAKSSTHSTKV